MRIVLVLAFALSYLIAPLPSQAAASGDRPPGAARFTFEVGTSTDHFHHEPSDPTGYDYYDARNGDEGFSAAIGFEPDERMLGPIRGALMLGFESYPRGDTREVLAYGGGVSELQIGARRKVAFTIAEDLRIVIGPWHRGEAFLDLGMGWTWVHGEPREDRSPSTGEVTYTYPGAKFSGLLFEAGAGLRTHRLTGLDWMMGVRARGYTDILNAARSFAAGETRGGNNTNGGSTTQLYLGIVTPRRH